jgi:hypothetical protein
MRDAYLRAASQFKQNGGPSSPNRRFYLGYARAHHRLGMADVIAAKAVTP